MIDCVILDGGEASRARPYLGDAPKCLAPLSDGRVVLDHLFAFLLARACRRVVLALSEGREAVLRHLTTEYRAALPFPVATDVSPRVGTVSAVLHALNARLPVAFDGFGRNGLMVMNGDTLLRGITGLQWERPYLQVWATDFVTGAVGPCGIRIIRNPQETLSGFAGLNLEQVRMDSFWVNGQFLDIGTPEGWAARERWFK